MPSRLSIGFVRGINDTQTIIKKPFILHFHNILIKYNEGSVNILGIPLW